MTQKNQGNVVLITGSNSGIGNATAKLTVEAGYITYGGARHESNFSAVQSIGAHPLFLDVTNEHSMVEAVRYIERNHGAVDVLINNAGYGQMGPIETVTPDQLLRQYETNVFGLIRMAQLVIPAMRQQKQGRIINISSMGGQFTFPLAAAYHSTKYAVESINEALRFELKSFGIHVISVQPGPVATPMVQTAVSSLRVAPDSPYHDVASALYRRSQQSLGYLSPEYVAKTILRAVTSRTPRPRYKIGMMAHVMPMLHSVVSDRMWDRILGRFYA